MILAAAIFTVALWILSYPDRNTWWPPMTDGCTFAYDRNTSSTRLQFIEWDPRSDGGYVRCDPGHRNAPPLHRTHQSTHPAQWGWSIDHTGCKRCRWDQLKHAQRYACWCLPTEQPPSRPSAVLILDDIRNCRKLILSSDNKSIICIPRTLH
jgi:hypothetical protein